MEQINSLINRLIEKCRTVFLEIKKIDVRETLAKLKDVPKEVYYKNAPAFIILMIGFIYLFILSKSPSFFWSMFFLISFIFAIFITAYWKRDKQFNLYLSITLLWLTFTLSGYTSLNLMVSKLVERILTFL